LTFFFSVQGKIGRNPCGMDKNTNNKMSELEQKLDVTEKVGRQVKEEEEEEKFVLSCEDELDIRLMTALVQSRTCPAYFWKTHNWLIGSNMALIGTLGMDTHISNEDGELYDPIFQDHATIGNMLAYPCARSPYYATSRFLGFYAACNDEEEEDEKAYDGAGRADEYVQEVLIYGCWIARSAMTYEQIDYQFL